MKEMNQIKNVYISTKFQEIKKFNTIKDKLNENNIHVKLDWTKHKSCKPFSKNKELCCEQANEDILGIKNSDVFIMYYNGIDKGSGMFFELGYAYSLNKEIYVYGENIENISMFIHLKGINIRKDIDQIIKEIKNG